MYASTVLFVIIGLVSHVGSAQMSCLQARQQCYGDARCRDALGIFKKVCGPELVACTTSTQSKCRRVLRTLQSYDYLIECRCGEPHMDFTCYTFRDSIFNHPCDNINPDEQESLMVLPKCDLALKSCRGEPSCVKDYFAFLKVCKISKDGNRCESHNMNDCHKAWTKIRQSQVFGCICPPPEPRTEAVGQNIYYDSSGYRREDKISQIRDLTLSDQDQGSCLKIFNETHRNPCLTNSKVPDASQIEEIQQTCHNALRSCQNDEDECLPLLSDVMMWCEHTHCEPDRCRASLQNFYSRVGIRRRLEVAFCVCRQNDRDGECLTAMRKLHPTCAQRQAGREEKKCHEIAAHCRKNPNCRARLEEYESSCSTDEMTKKCSGTHRGCQFAVTKILGTELHASCVCKGTDFLHQRDCYDWQKLLWSNACVIESHLALQDELRRGENLDDVFTKAPLSTTTPTPPRIPSTPDSMQKPYLPYGTMVYRKIAQGPSMSGPYDVDSLIPGGSQGSVYDSMGKHVGQGMKPSFGPNIQGPMGCPPEDPHCRRTIWGGGRRIRPNGLSHGKGGRRENGDKDGRFPPGRGVPNGFGRDRVKWKSGIQIGRGGDVIGSGRSEWEESHRGTGVPMTPVGGGHYGSSGKMPNNFGMHHPSNLNPSRNPLYSQTNMKINYPTQYIPNNNYKDEFSGGEYEISTQETISSTDPPRYCIIKGTSEEKGVESIRIPEGAWRRIYKKEDCSSLCKCPETKPNQEILHALCYALGCIPHKGCNTSMAHYPHSSPYYQANRGACMCYYGNFICERPDPTNMYDLGPGIYLFLGYSKHEMELLKHRTRANELEALVEIENLLVKKYGFKCKLITKKHIGENLILLAELRMDVDSAYLSPYLKQQKEKEECKQPLQELTEKINARPRHPEVSEDAYLSMFILAELHVNLPEPHTSPSADARPLKPSFNLLLLMLIGLLFLMCEEEITGGGGGLLSNLNIFSKRIPSGGPPREGGGHLSARAISENLSNPN